MINAISSCGCAAATARIGDPQRGRSTRLRLRRSASARRRKALVPTRRGTDGLADERAPARERWRGRPWCVRDHAPGRHGSHDEAVRSPGRRPRALLGGDRRVLGSAEGPACPRSRRAVWRTPPPLQRRSPACWPTMFWAGSARRRTIAGRRAFQPDAAGRRLSRRASVHNPVPRPSLETMPHASPPPLDSAPSEHRPERTGCVGSGDAKCSRPLVRSGVR